MVGNAWTGSALCRGLAMWAVQRVIFARAAAVTQALVLARAFAFALVLALALALAGSIRVAAATEAQAASPTQFFEFESQQQKLSMAYVDAQPAGPPIGTVLLLHGKNFSGDYWIQTVELLRAKGFRVVVPDQIGFGRSSMPGRYQFSFAQLAANTKMLLMHLCIGKARVMGHSMGGMLGIQFALQYPEVTEQLLLLNPIGLEDWRAQGVPYVSIDKLHEAELGKDFASIRVYQQRNYYDGAWTPEFERWARLLADQYAGERRAAFAWNMALTADMILSQPVVYRLDQLRAPTVLMIGTRDKTALGRGRVDEKLAAQMGDYTRLGKVAAQKIPHATLIEFDGVGHLPHIEAPARYWDALDSVLSE